ncbi:MAG: MFS transporter [Rhodovarius sp.]|nr:MFS transporter [Rhodovarius sp.]
MEPPLMDAAERAMRATVWRLFFCQALMQGAVVGQVAMAPLVGHSLSGDATLATLPMAVQMTAVMAASIPAGLLFARLGRKAGFVAGALASIAGSLLFAAGVYLGDFLVYCLGAVFAGAGFGIAQHYRFAASEVASPAYRARAISLVMAGPILSALLGPELVKQTHDLLLPWLFLATYLLLAVLPLICLLLLAGTRLPPPPPRPKQPVPLGPILARPAFVAAAVAGLVAYGAMNLIMTATPLEMMLCGFSVSASAAVIQWHAVAMFAPGFVTGRLIQRFGMRPVMIAGAVLTAACAAVTVAGSSYWHFVVGLVLLGVGWNFMFVGATALLATAHAPEERIKAQTANDVIVFGTVACTAFLSGYLHAAFGWQVLNLAILPTLAAAAALLFWQARHGAKTARATG